MKLYIDVFVLGVTLSWGPCLSFCAPLILPLIAGTQKGWLAGLKMSLAFSLARIVPYVILSLISASLGSYLIKKFYASQAGWLIYIGAAAFITLLGIIILIGEFQHWHFCLPFKKIAAKGVKETVLLGLMLGFSPCIPLLGLLTYIAVNSQNLMHGALLGLTFGVGTLVSPLVFFAPLAGGISGLLVKRPLAYKIFSRICGLLLIYFGIGMILNAL